MLIATVKSFNIIEQHMICGLINQVKDGLIATPETLVFFGEAYIIRCIEKCLVPDHLSCAARLFALELRTRLLDTITYGG